MNAEQLSVFVGQFAAGLPREIGKQLEDVELIVCETPEIATQELNELLDTEDDAPAVEAIPVDCKGIFVGEPLEREDDDEESEHETVSLPNGVIAIIACNIKDGDEAVLVCLHEIGHALGMDEEEVKALGLGVSPSTGVTTNDASAQAAGPSTDGNPV
jgi:predicted Zn-dependent protease with MMP-like domain